MAVEDGSTPVDAPDEDHDAPFESDEDTEVKAPASSMYEGLLQLVTTAFVEKAFSADTAVSSQYKQLQAGRKHFNEDKRAFETAVAESESSGIFTDASFKACADSLCHDWKHAHVSVQWRDFIWCRPEEIPDDKGARPTLFSHPVCSNDIRQGALPDCYILSAMSALAENPKFVQHLFPPDRQRPELGLFTVRLCERGHWRDFLVDDLLPCFSHREGSELVFSKCADGRDLWVPLVEKALAKQVGSFQGLATADDYAGQAGEALTTFTGAPCEYLVSSDPQLFDKIKAAVCRAPGFKPLNWFVVGVLPDGAGDMHAQDLGLVLRHSYAILDARELTVSAASTTATAGGDGSEAAATPAGTTKTERILQLRNPWGESNWHGPWGPGTAEWTPEVLQQMADDKGVHALEGVHSTANGVFWLSLDDFEHYFAGAQICRASPEWPHSSEDVRVPQGSTAVLALTVKGDGPAVVDLTAQQYDHHIMAVKYHSVAPLLGVRMQVIDTTTLRLVASTQLVRQRDVWLGIPALPPGRYWVLVETDWDGSPRADADDSGIVIGVCVRSTASEIDIIGVQTVQTAASVGPVVDGRAIKRAMLHAMCLSCPEERMDTLFPDLPRRKLAGNITKRFYAGEDTFAWLYENNSRSLCLTEILPFELTNMQFVEGHTPLSRREPDKVTMSVRPGEARLLAIQQAHGGFFKWTIPSKGDVLEAEDPYAEAFLEDV